jgi:hypothetical protein
MHSLAAGEASGRICGAARSAIPLKFALLGQAVVYYQLCSGGPRSYQISVRSAHQKKSPNDPITTAATTI